MGHGDLRKIKSGIIALSEKTTTKIGMILGIITTLIVPFIIIFSIATVVGVNVFNASSSQANRDGIIADGVNIASLAQMYYHKPTKIGGGGNSFNGFQIPESIIKTENGTYDVVINNSKSLTIICVGKEIGNDGNNPVKVKFDIEPNSIINTSIIN